MQDDDDSDVRCEDHCGKGQRLHQVSVHRVHGVARAGGRVVVEEMGHGKTSF